MAKRRKGVTPAHLRPYLFKKGHGATRKTSGGNVSKAMLLALLRRWRAIQVKINASTAKYPDTSGLTQIENELEKFKDFVKRNNLKQVTWLWNEIGKSGDAPVHEIDMGIEEVQSL